MRCLTLAEELRQNGAVVFFICRELPGHLCSHLEDKHFSVLRLYTYDVRESHASWLGVSWQQDAEEVSQILRQEFLKKKRRIDWLVVDHYALDRRWEEKMRPFVDKIMVIDDLADRSHDCDLLLDQNLYENMESRYDGLVPENCRKLLGPQYALLRPEFIKARANLRKRDGTVKCILVFLGGADPTNETAKALEAIQLLERPDIAVDVVVGLSNPHREQIKEICSTMPNTSYHCQVDNVAELMAQADLAIGAGGIATWERCCLGLPSITMITAENQERITSAVALHQAILNLGNNKNVGSEDIFEALNILLTEKNMLLAMTNAALSIISGIEAKENIITGIILGKII
ncbi:MAG: UDP-2,4-diacetamido-2,4,6-trideoxy-beta-L-altropyranose hydrolase [Bacillota bacterium]